MILLVLIVTVIFILSDLMFNEPCPSKRKKSAKTIKRYNYKNK